MMFEDGTSIQCRVKLYLHFPIRLHDACFIKHRDRFSVPLSLFRWSSRDLFLQLNWDRSQEKFAIADLVEHVGTRSLNIWYRE
jgi:hypothetical protein